MSPFRTRRPVATWLAVALALTVATIGGETVWAQSPPPPPPLRAFIFFNPPPPTGTFGPADPISIVLQLCHNTGTRCPAPSAGTPIVTTVGFDHADHFRNLFFTAVAGGIITNRPEAQTHAEVAPRFCLSRGGRLLRPAALAVLPPERLDASFFFEQKFNARDHYTLPPGRYTVNARIPFARAALINDCDTFPGETLVDLRASDQFTLISNDLEVVVSQLRFEGFSSPLVNDAACGASPPVTPPCRTVKLGSTIAVKFKLFEGTTPVTTARPQIAVKPVTAVPPSSMPDDLGTGAGSSGTQFTFDPTTGEYKFNLNTKPLTAGVWRIEARLDDGTVKFVHVGLR